MNADDLLSFKDFPPVNDIDNDNNTNSRQQYHIGQTGASGERVAQLNINSPRRNNNNPFAAPGVGGSSVLSGDPLDNLINDMSTSINMLNSQDQQQSGNMQQQIAQTDSPTSNDKTNPIYSFFSIEYYQQFFNVDTSMVLERITSAIIPKRAPMTYLEKQIGKNPDLYGPFWIVMTLIFSIAISGNLANYLQYANTDYHWRYNFHLVSYAATAIFMYICFVPLGLWATFKWFVRPTDQDIESDAPYTPTLLTLICIYGYSMAIYIPVSILWVIQISFLQWILVISAAFVSGSVLILILTPALRVSKISIIIAIGIIAAHFLMATGFMLYFFHVPEQQFQATVIHAALPQVQEPPANGTVTG